MKWEEVTKEEYKRAFQEICEDIQQIYKDVRGLMYLIEHDSNLGYDDGFVELKQRLIRYQIIYPLVKIEEALDGEIKKEKYR